MLSTLGPQAKPSSYCRSSSKGRSPRVSLSPLVVTSKLCCHPQGFFSVKASVLSCHPYYYQRTQDLLVWLTSYRTTVNGRTYHHLSTWLFVECHSHPSLPGPDEDSHTVDFRALLRFPPPHQGPKEEGPQTKTYHNCWEQEMASSATGLGFHLPSNLNGPAQVIYFEMKAFIVTWKWTRREVAPHLGWAHSSFLKPSA